MMDFDGGMGGSAWLLMTIVWVLLIGAVVWAVASLFPARGGRTEAVPERPEEILDRRLVRGEIDPATYDELRGKLTAARMERM
jgi:uncharacterized membrane protein